MNVTEDIVVAPAPQHDKRPHLRALTSLRFFLALAVVLVHYDLLVAGGKLIGAHYAWGVGVAAVIAFFVLSGFIITYQYFDRAESIDRKSFWRARLARIGPMYWFSMLLALSVIPAINLPNSFWFPIVIPTSLLFIQSWFPNINICCGLNGPAYTLSIEFLFYLIFPLIVGRVARRLLPWVLGAMAFSVALPFVMKGDLVPYSMYSFPPSRVAEFVIGIASAMLFLRYRTVRIKHPFAVELIALLSFVGFIVLVSPFYRNDAPLLVSLLKFGTALLFAAVLFVFGLNRGFLSRMLGWAPLVLLGEISYALYLIHDLFCRYLHHAPITNAFLNTWCGFWAFSAVVSLFALVCFLCIEKPWRTAIVSWRLPKGPAPIVGFAIVILLSFWHEAYFPAMEFASGPIANCKNISFADSVVLDRIHVWRVRSGLEVSAYWRPAAHPSEAANLAVHLIDRSGKILHQLDHPLLGSVTSPNLLYHDHFLVPNDFLIDSKGLALAVFRDPKQTLLITGDGKTDWGNHRLLIPLPQTP